MEEIKRLLLEEKAALLSEIQEKTGNKNKLNRFYIGSLLILQSS